jgi:hypothetical protein
MVAAIDAAVARAARQPDPPAAFQREVIGIETRQQQLAARFAELGLHDCAGQRPA